MSLTVADLVVKARADTADAERGLDRLNQGAHRTGGFFSSAASTALGFTAAIAGIAAASGAFNFASDAVIGMNASLETSTLQFQTLMGDADKAEEHVRSLFTFAARTPFETGPIIAASKHLQVFGGDALNTEKNLTLVGDAAAAMNVPIDEIAFWVGRAYNAIQAGKPFGESAARLQEMGVLTAEARAQMEEMQATGADVSDVWGVMNTDLGRLSGAMELQAGTWQGLVSTLMDGAKMAIANAFQPLFERGKEALSGLISIIGSEEFQTGISDFATSAMDAAQNIIGALVEIVPHLIEVGASIIEWLGPKVSAVIEFVSREVIPALVAVLVGLGEWVTTHGPTIGSILSQAFDFIREAVELVWPVLRDLGATILPPLGEALGAVATIINDNFPAVKLVLIGVAGVMAGMFAASVVTSIIGMGTAFIGLIPQVIAFGVAATAALGPVGLIIIGITAVVAALALAWSTNFLGIQDITAAVGGVIGDVIGTIIDVFGNVIDFMVQNVFPVFEAMGTGIDSVMRFIGDVFSNVWNAILNFLGGVVGTMIGIIKNVVGAAASIPGPWQEGAQQTQAALSAMESSVRAWGTETINVASTAGPAATGAFTRALNDARPHVDYASRHLAYAAGAPLSEEAGRAYGHGATLGQNFLNGMNAYYSRIRAASISLGAAAASGIQLRSPAKVGPLSEPAELWSMRLVRDYARGFKRAIPRLLPESLNLGGAVRGTLSPRPPRMATVTAGGGGPVIVNFYADRYVGTREEARMYEGQIARDVRSLLYG